MASIERRLSKVLTPSGLRRQPTTHYDEAAAQAAKLAEEAHRSIMGLAGAAVETMSPAAAATQKAWDATQKAWDASLEAAAATTYDGRVGSIIGSTTSFDAAKVI